MKLGLVALSALAMVCLAGAKEPKTAPQVAKGVSEKLPRVTWRGTWSVAAEGQPYMAWNRAVLLKNTTTRSVIAEVYSFLGEAPTPQFVQACALRAVKAVDLSPGESVATGVWCAEDPAKAPGARILLFTCSSRELSRVLEERARDPHGAGLPFAIVSP